MSDGDGSAPPGGSKSNWTSFLKSLASFNGDLSTMTAPAFILSSTSLTEFSAYWAESPSILVAPAKEEDPQKRALLVLQWFLTTLKSQYSSRNEKLGSEKKPLNPFLGEVFLGHWEDEAGTTQLVSEQVSHHPPVTAYCITNAEHQVQLQGYNAQKASFGTSLAVKQVGHALLQLEKFKESYLITLPSLHIEGLWSGSPFIELEKHTFIQSSSGYTAKIDFTGRGWLSGKKNTFTATLYPTGKEKGVLYTIDGQWTGEFSIKDSSKSVIDTYNAKTAKTTPLNVKPIEEQVELESRQAWRKVAEGIQKGDLHQTSHYKSIIENQQRELRKKEHESGQPWEQIFFSDVMTAYPEFEQLSGKIGLAIDAKSTGGVWRYDEKKSSTAKPPYKEGFTFQKS